MISDLGSLARALRRNGALDPSVTSCAIAAAAAWGASPVMPYSAAAMRHPGRDALHDDYGSITYRELHQRTNRVAGAIREIGATKTSVVGLLCRNHRGFVEANIAVAKLGARVVYLNTGLPERQLLEVVERERIDLIFADRDFVPYFSAVSDCRIVVAAPEDDDSWTFPDLAQTSRFFRLPDPRLPNAPVLLTSGTTGAPKGAVRASSPKALSSAIGFLEAVPYVRGDVFVVPAPLFHAWGLSQLMIAASLAGSVVLRRHFDVDDIADDIDTYRATVLAVVPVMLQRLLDAKHLDLTGVRIVASSGSALTGDLATTWMARHGRTLYNVYGSTEVGQVAVASPADLSAAPGIAGRAVRGVDVRIVDVDGASVRQGDVGDIVVRSDAHFDGYTTGDTKRRVGDHMSIGDVGLVDGAGRLFVHGRADDMIISGGENLYPSNIERCLALHEAVRAVVVVGVEDPDLGQRVRAVVVADAELSEAQLTRTIKAHAKKGLASFEVPREFIYVTDFPRNETGKVLRRELLGDARSLPYARPAVKKASDR